MMKVYQAVVLCNGQSEAFTGTQGYVVLEDVEKYLHVMLDHDDTWGPHTHIEIRLQSWDRSA